MANVALRKAAVLLASLPEGQAASLLATLSPADAAAVSAEAAVMGPVGREEQEAVIHEFATSVSSPVEDCPTKSASPFAFLHDMGPNDLLLAIGNEHPQTIALILSQLPAEQAAGVIALLSPDQQASVIGRITKIAQPDQEIVAEVAEAIRRWLAGPERVPASRGMAKVVKMFGSMRPKTERRLLGGIAQADPELLRAIRRAMFGPDVAACGEWNVTAAAS
jgi:flagellar motor switch protein FliG